MLSQARIESILPIGDLGRQVVYLDTVGSTNDLAKSLGEGSYGNGTLVVADEQTQGRGRGERGWLTPAGTALALSVLLRPGLGAGADALALNGLGAIAAVDAVEAFGGNARIKWPNDVLLAGRKAAGVLAEVSWAEDQVEYAVIGIGVNVQRGSAPPDDQVLFPATSLEEALGKPVDRLELLRAIVAQLDRWQGALGKPGLVEAWQERLAYLGEQILLEQQGEAVQGELVGLAGDGRLRLRLAGGQEIVTGQDFVHLRPVDSRLE
jgi:BirA family biotin operon repressor/biotin-[acetyl-CoA-carboxylase] ligase